MLVFGAMEDITNDEYLAPKLKPIHRASIHPIHFDGVFLGFFRSRRNALSMLWCFFRGRHSAFSTLWLFFVAGAAL